MPPRCGSSTLNRQGLRNPTDQISGAAAAADKRVVGGNVEAFRIAVADVDVDPKHLAVQLREILRLVRRIVGLAAVAGPDVEIAVGAEDQVPAVVERLGMRDEPVAGRPLQIESRRRIGDERIAGER